MPNVNISINLRRPLGAAQWLDKEGLRALANLLHGVSGGSVESEGVRWHYNDNVAVQNVNSFATPACGLLVASGGAGSVGGTIGGTAKTVTWATSDTASMTALAAAIRADTTIGLFASATNKLAKMTCASVLAGTTVLVNNQTFTAIANGATPVNHGEFSVGASDTACALNLVTAINRHPAIAGRSKAASILGVVYVGPQDDRTALPVDGIRSPSAATITVNTAIPVAGPVLMLLSNPPGVVGNFVTVVASGTGMTYSTNGTAGQLGQGTGGALPASVQDVQP